MMKLYQGDSLNVLKKLKANSVDSIVTDPPYGLSFMGKAWDYQVPSTEIWKECLRVLKPGGHLLAFGGTRTYHRLVVNIEDAGFEIRDQIQWIYGSGFPKSMDISKAIDKAAGQWRGRAGKVIYDNQAMSSPNYERTDKGEPITEDAKRWSGYGTALKPANEPICLARKPLSEKTVAKNVLKHGTGGMNIDGTRIEGEKPLLVNTEGDEGLFGMGSRVAKGTTTEGRFPANVIFSHADGCREVGVKKVKSKSTGADVGSKNSIFGGSGIQLDKKSQVDADGTETIEAWECVEGCPVKVLDEQSGILKTGGAGKDGDARESVNTAFKQKSRSPRTTAGDSGGASRFFYVAKASKKDRGEGNNHPTVKPIKLMEYLIKLVTPEGGTVLDPFMGSGTTGVAAKALGFSFIGIELSPEYFSIAYQRVV